MLLTVQVHEIEGQVVTITGRQEDTSFRLGRENGSNGRDAYEALSQDERTRYRRYSL